MLHGFPAETPVRPEWEKNQDIAARIAQSVPVDVYLSHYRGLGKSPGSFSFRRSVSDSLDLARAILNGGQHRILHVIGHSWGALVAMNVVRAIGGLSGKIILLSPFNDIPSDDVLERVLRGVCVDVPIRFEAGDIQGAVQEIRAIAQDGDSRRIAAEITTVQGQVTILQAISDDEVPTASTREFVKYFRIEPEYIEVESDHKFSVNREHLIDLIISRLRKE